MDDHIGAILAYRGTGTTVGDKFNFDIQLLKTISHHNSCEPQVFNLPLHIHCHYIYIYMHTSSGHRSATELRWGEGGTSTYFSPDLLSVLSLTLVEESPSSLHSRGIIVQQQILDAFEFLCSTWSSQNIHKFAFEYL